MCNYQNQLQLVTLGFKRNSTHLWVSFTKCLFNLLSRSIHLYYKGLRSYFKEDVSTLVERNSCQRNLKLVLEKIMRSAFVLLLLKEINLKSFLQFPPLFLSLTQLGRVFSNYYLSPTC